MDKGSEPSGQNSTSNDDVTSALDVLEIALIKEDQKKKSGSLEPSEAVKEYYNYRYKLLSRKQAVTLIIIVMIIGVCVLAYTQYKRSSIQPHTPPSPQLSPTLNPSNGGGLPPISNGIIPSVYIFNANFNNEVPFKFDFQEDNILSTSYISNGELILVVGEKYIQVAKIGEKKIQR